MYICIHCIPTPARCMHAATGLYRSTWLHAASFRRSLLHGMGSPWEPCKVPQGSKISPGAILALDACLLRLPAPPSPGLTLHQTNPDTRPITANPTFCLNQSRTVERLTETEHWEKKTKRDQHCSVPGKHSRSLNIGRVHQLQWDLVQDPCMLNTMSCAV